MDPKVVSPKPTWALHGYALPMIINGLIYERMN
jgi:hypothetical protein